MVELIPTSSFGSLFFFMVDRVSDVGDATQMCFKGISVSD